MGNVLAVITAWCVAHPLVVMLAWPLFSAAVTWIFRKHSDSEYAKLPTWLGHVLRFVAALGIDSGSVLGAFASLFGVGKPPAGGGSSGPRLVPEGSRTDETVPPMASKIAGAPIMGPILAVLITVSLLHACKGLTPSNVQNIENLVNAVEQDACIMAADFAPSTDARTIAEVCGFVQAGTPIAEDVLNHILQMLETKKRSKDPATKAKYAARLAAQKPTDAGTQ